MSIGGDTITYQAVSAVRLSGGTASNISQKQVAEYQRELAKTGFYLESSAAMVIGALTQLIDDKIVPQGAGVLMIATSNGYKDIP